MKRAGPFAPRSSQVAVVGVALADRPNAMDAIVRVLAAPSSWRVTQRWMAVGGTRLSPAVEKVIAGRRDPAPKFDLLNELIGGLDLDAFDYLLACDDDVGLPEGFLDNFLGISARYDFSLAQPARTLDSFIDHHFVGQLPGLLARRTRFVEIGPVFSVRRDAYPLVLPFDGDAKMGWGLDFVWPVRVEEAGLKMGIVDGAPVEHSLRPPQKTYAHGDAAAQQERFLAAHPHLSWGEAFRILESYP